MSPQRTLAIIKPDVVELRKHGLVLQRILDEGFKILAMRQIHMTKGDAEGFYELHRGKPFYDGLCDFMCSGPAIVLALERDDAVAHWRQVIGATNPAEAASGTIRKQLGTAIGRNAAHGSDSEENGLSECTYFFSGIDLRA